MKSYAFAKHVCAEPYAKEKQFDDEIDDRDKKTAQTMRETTRKSL